MTWEDVKRQSRWIKKSQEDYERNRRRYIDAGKVLSEWDPFQSKSSLEDRASGRSETHEDERE